RSPTRSPRSRSWRPQRPPRAPVQRTKPGSAGTRVRSPAGRGFRARPSTCRVWHVSRPHPSPHHGPTVPAMRKPYPGTHPDTREAEGNHGQTPTNTRRHDPWTHGQVPTPGASGESKAVCPRRNRSLRRGVEGASGQTPPPRLRNLHVTHQGGQSLLVGGTQLLQTDLDDTTRVGHGQALTTHGAELGDRNTVPFGQCEELPLLTGFDRHDRTGTGLTEQCRERILGDLHPDPLPTTQGGL